MKHKIIFLALTLLLMLPVISWGQTATPTDTPTPTVTPTPTDTPTPTCTPMATVFLDGPLRFAFSYTLVDTASTATIDLPAVTDRGYLIQRITTVDSNDLTLSMSIGGVTVFKAINDVSITGNTMIVDFPDKGFKTAKNTAVRVAATNGAGAVITMVRVEGTQWN